MASRYAALVVVDSRVGVVRFFFLRSPDAYVLYLCYPTDHINLGVTYETLFCSCILYPPFKHFCIPRNSSHPSISRQTKKNLANLYVICPISIYSLAIAKSVFYFSQIKVLFPPASYPGHHNAGVQQQRSDRQEIPYPLLLRRFPLWRRPVFPLSPH